MRNTMCEQQQQKLSNRWSKRKKMPSIYDLMKCDEAFQADKASKLNQ